MSGTEGIFSSAHISSALRFWEPMRAVYNAVLMAAFFPFGGSELLWQGKVTLIAGLIVLAAAANLLYCVAYPVDCFLQSSSWRDNWVKWGRIVMFLAGVLIALALEYLTVFAMTIA
jgi:hypothetical protein